MKCYNRFCVLTQIIRNENKGKNIIFFTCDFYAPHTYFFLFFLLLALTRRVSQL